MQSVFDYIADLRYFTNALALDYLDFYLSIKYTNLSNFSAVEGFFMGLVVFLGMKICKVFTMPEGHFAVRGTLTMALKKKKRVVTKSWQLVFRLS